jgi:hypothetical protein
MENEIDYVTPRKSGVHAKIRAICDLCANMIKDGRNQAQSYNFTSYDSTVMTLRPHLSRYGLRLKFSEVSSSIDTTLKTNAGKPATGATVKYRLYVIDVETGEFDATEASNFATDTADKAMSKAITAAKKYLLFDEFEISTSGGANTHDDGDQDANPLDDDGTRKAQQRAQPPREQQRPAAKNDTKQVLDANSPAPAPLLVQIRRLIETVKKDIDEGITEAKVVAKHAQGKATLEDTNFSQAMAINNALQKYLKSAIRRKPTEGQNVA